jgi:hypothetical protein
MPRATLTHRRTLAASLGGALALSATVLASGPAHAATALPSHVYAPYFETWTTDSIATVAQQSGAKYFTLAFLQTLSKGSCTLAWNGTAGQTVASGRYLADIAALRATGGDVFPSFGGWSADQGGTEIADSCTDVNQIAAAYEQVITTYDVSRLDMDVEGRSLTNSAGIDRRNKAIAIVEAWAAAQGRPLTVQYTLPVLPSGLDTGGQAVMSSAVADGARVDSVDIMVFDYYDGTTQMGSAALSAANALHAQLAALYPSKTSAQINSMEAMTLLPGIDDYPKKTEVTYLPDAQQMLTYAQTNGLNELSTWAVQRDNGGCPGVRDSNSCSGITQNAWDFSHLLEPFTS